MSTSTKIEWTKSDDGTAGATWNPGQLLIESVPPEVTHLQHLVSGPPEPPRRLSNDVFDLLSDLGIEGVDVRSRVTIDLIPADARYDANMVEITIWPPGAGGAN